MICSLSDLKNKEVINVADGAKLGYVDDIEFNTETDTIIALIIYGRSRLFGLLGKDDDIIIKCGDIQIIGIDTILIKFDTDSAKSTKKRSFIIENLYK